jgi:hypothetical protein
MPTDELKQRIEEMKIAAQKAHELMEVCEEEWFDSEHLQRSVRFVSEDADLIEACSPPAVLALISELERLQGENERLEGGVRRLRALIYPPGTRF